MVRVLLAEHRVAGHEGARELSMLLSCASIWTVLLGFLRPGNFTTFSGLDPIRNLDS